MASNILGQLIVNLLANTASFEQGMNAASKQAASAAKEIKGTFTEMGDAIGSIFGELGAPIEAMFSGIGSASSSILGTLGPLGGAFGAVGLGIAGVAAAGLAAGAVVLGMALKGSEAAAKLEELSQATGVSVENLSLLGDVASTKGIGIDQMAKAIEKMDKAALAAAQSGPKASNAFKDLGVSVTNADGSMREATDIFNDVSAKFATMPDGPLKTAEAIKIFGRSGADMIPLLNEGGKGIAELEGHFKALNDVVDGPTAAASAKLKTNMTLVGAVFSGFQNQLVKDLVPALNEVAQTFVQFFEENQDAVKDFADGLSNVAKVVLNVFQIVGELLATIYRIFMTAMEGIQDVGATVGKVAEDISTGHLKDVWKDVKAGAATTASGIKQNFSDAINAISGQITSMGNVWMAVAPAEKARPTGGPPIESKATDVGFVNQQVIKDQAAANKELAAAMRDSTAAGIEEAAAEDAEGQIAELEAKAKEKGVEGTKAFKNAMADAIPKIEAATLAQETFKAAAADQKEFESFTSKIKEQTDALNQEATVQGKAAQAQQKALASLEPLAAKLAALKTVYADMLTSETADETTKTTTLALINKLQGEYDAATAAVQKYNIALQNKAVTDELGKINAQVITLRTENDALASADPFGKLDAELQKFLQTNVLTVAQVTQLKQKMDELKSETIKGDVLKTAQTAGGFDPAALTKYSDEINYLNANWQQLGLTEQQYHQAMLVLQKDYDDLKAKGGNTFDALKAGFADFAASVPTMTATMTTVITQGLNGISTNFTDMIVKGKANWKSLFDSMESTILNSAIKGLMSSMLTNLFSATNSGAGGIFGGLTSMLSGGKGGAGGGAAALQLAGTTLETAGTTLVTSGTTLNTAAAELMAAATALQSSSMTSGMGGGGGGGGFDLSGLFGGGMAEGGDVTPGKAYVVGEHHPELFVPQRSGTIVPQVMTQAGNTIHQTVNIQTQDADSFMRSKNQVAASLHRMTGSAYQRTSR